MSYQWWMKLYEFRPNKCISDHLFFFFFMFFIFFRWRDLLLSKSFSFHHNNITPPSCLCLMLYISISQQSTSPSLFLLHPSIHQFLGLTNGVFSWGNAINGSFSIWIEIINTNLKFSGASSSSLSHLSIYYGSTDFSPDFQKFLIPFILNVLVIVHTSIHT